MNRNFLVFLLLGTCFMACRESEAQSDLELLLRSQQEMKAESGRYVSMEREEKWLGSKTAIIVCDVWDYHHCLNAVRRLNEFLPRLNEVLIEARRRGVIVIHAPSDCMDAYHDHPARLRAMRTPSVERAPDAIESWCSLLPTEEKPIYPIDQSDGGEDDDPEEHAAWASELKSLGRNPNMPWKRQADGIKIDGELDYISDRGDEVWNILAEQNIANVILTGVHTNMCVLGRPFGLRQMARNGKNVVLMRDMTDTMYNPQRWPYVSHFEGTRRVIAHIERFVCPTITSDQFIGGKPFRFANDSGSDDSVDMLVPSSDPEQQWVLRHVPDNDPKLSQSNQTCWYRCVIRLPKTWQDRSTRLSFPDGDELSVWINGKSLNSRKLDNGEHVFEPDENVIDFGDANLLVVRCPPDGLPIAPVIHSDTDALVLEGQWQHRLGDDPAWSNMPLPAKFGGSPDIVFSPDDPLWTPRALTRPGSFTTGIEGPACDRDGNVYAVNYLKQGTIGRVTPEGRGHVYVELPEGSIGNGIRFSPDGSFFVADYVKHNILRVDTATRTISVHAHDQRMNQPNDLTLAMDGKTLFASDPNWAKETGQLWRIDEDGSTTLLAKDMGTTNGIEAGPDGKRLYVNESVQRNVWVFDITDDMMLANKRLLHQFEDHSMDGMRCDIDGNLYITRYGKGTVVKLSPEGKVLREIPVLGARPSNICFGGPDRRTAYVTEVESQRLVRFRVDRPGRN